MRTSHITVTRGGAAGRGQTPGQPGLRSLEEAGGERLLLSCDPGPQHHLSEDLTSVRCGARQQLHENPERLQYGVLGSWSLESGTPTREVEVGDGCWQW